VGREDFEKGYFEKYYEGEAASRSSVHKFRTYSAVLRQHLSSGSVLEIGSGYGGFIQVASVNYHIVGTDISADALLEVRKRLPETPMNLVCAGATALPFNRTFDAIVSLDCLEHVEEIEQSFDEISRLQTKNGILMIVVPVYDTLVGKLVEILDSDETHVNKWSRHKWLAMINKLGYSTLKVYGAWRYLVFGKWYINFIVPFWRISPAILVIARKSST